MNTLLKISVLSALALTTGCVSILPDAAPPPAIYRLETSTRPADKIANPEIVRVDRPGASQIFNTNDIVVTRDGQKLSTIAQARWSEVTPVVIQDAMIDSLASSRSFIGLLPISGAKTDTRLHLSIKNFEANFDRGPEQAPAVIVHYRVTYARAEDRSLLGTYTVRKTERAESINVSSIVAAMEVANAAAMSDIVDWLEARRVNAPA